MKYLFLLSILFFACSGSSRLPGVATHAPQLIKLWETDTVLIANESAVYHAATNAIYVSCMGKSEDVKDGDGYIAKLNLQGEIIEHYWIRDLNCPKGLAVLGDVLYATDINELITVDIKTKHVTKTNIPSGSFFNDIDVAPNGDLYLSEGVNQEIVKISAGKDEVYYSTKSLRGLNGVHVNGNDVLFTSSGGKIHALSPDKTLRMVADSSYNGDGIETYGKGFFCSSWQGRIYYFTDGGNTFTLIDTTVDKIQSGDIEVVESKKLVISPTLFNNKVIAYRVEDR